MEIIRSMNIDQASVIFDSVHGTLKGKDVSRSVRRLADVAGIFADRKSLELMDQGQIVYTVEMHEPTKDVPGALYFGISHIHPGKVGSEFFMTKGHFHQIQDRAEYYWGIKGTGVLLMMDNERKSWMEEINPGSLHYIPGYVAHRIINTGCEELTVGACWPQDAGHDYQSIAESGFSVRIKEINGTVVIEPFS